MELAGRMDRRPRRAPADRPLSVSVRWFAVVFGAVTGLAASLALFVVLGLAGLIEDDGESVALLLLIYAAQLLAGYVAGRYAVANGALHGGLAALALFFLTALFAVAAGTEPTLVTIVFSLFVAAVIGSAGGALANWQRVEK